MIGGMTERIRVEQRVEDPDGQGGTSVTWALRCVVWARQRPLNGRESRMAGQMTAELSSVWEIWYRPDVIVTDRFRAGSRTLEIHGKYDADGSRTLLTLLCSEVQDGSAATGSHEGWIDPQLADAI